MVVDPRAFDWRNADWRGRPWHETVLYEVHVGAMGGFKGVEAALPRLRDLGITAVELMPIADFPGKRNWGYDGVLPYAPDTAYGTPDELKSLVDAAHGLGLMVFLDVVYNHFGPDGAYLHAYAKRFFDEGVHTPWGAAIDFREAAVRDYFEENALFWLDEYRFDGLRFDAVHAIAERDWLDALAARIRREITDRHVHLVLENERNGARHLRPAGEFDAQWNDDGHNILHPLLTGEREGYYEDFCRGRRGEARHRAGAGVPVPGPGLAASRRAARRALRAPAADRLRAVPPEPRPGRQPRLRRAAAQPRRSGGAARRDRAAAALAADPDAVHGRGMGRHARRSSSSPTTMPSSRRWCATAGARSSPSSPPSRTRRSASASPIRMPRRPSAPPSRIFPRPNARRTPPSSISTGSLLTLRRERIVPHLAGAASLGAEAIGEGAVLARWRLGRRLAPCHRLQSRGLGRRAPRPAAGELLFESADGAATSLASGTLPAQACVALVEPPDAGAAPTGKVVG